jgi:leader peptidase (prepilin peptidase)/N-methyltransferase
LLKLGPERPDKDNMDTFILAAAFVLGLIFGSFATVASYRIPRRETIVSGRSKCPSCDHTIGALENIPVLSWLALRGKCKHCRAPISVRYPAIELATGALFLFAAYKFIVSADDTSVSGWVTAATFAAFFWTLVVLTIIDLEHKLLPNRVVFPLFVVGWAGLIVAAATDGDMARLLDAAVGAVIFGGFFFLIAFIYPQGMGLGDVKLGFVLGTFLGFMQGPGLVLVGMFLSFFLGGVISIGVLVAQGGSRKTQIPFGPFLALGTVLALLLGQPLLDAYLGTF